MEGGRVVLITGTSRGLGKQLVKVFLEKEEGVRVWATTRKAPEEAQLEWKQHEKRNQIKFATLNVLSKQQIDNFIATVKQSGVLFDVVIHNAGIASMGSANRPPLPEESQKDIETNLIAVIKLSEILQPFLNPKCILLNMCSGLGALNRQPEQVRKLFSSPALTKEDILRLAKEYCQDIKNGKHERWFQRSYGVTKMMLGAWSRFIFKKQLKEGQKIICFTPGLCDTDMTTNFLPHIKRHSAYSGAYSAYRTICLKELDPQKFYHRARETDFETCGSNLPREDDEWTQ